MTRRAAADVVAAAVVSAPRRRCSSTEGVDPRPGSRGGAGDACAGAYGDVGLEVHARSDARSRRI